MKITKFAHSCLLVEAGGRAGLFDPGDFSWESGTFDLDKLTRLDDILITHGHADHLHLPFIQAVLAKFPDARITAPPDAAKTLAAEGVANAAVQGGNGIELFAADHEPLAPLTPEVPQNIGIHYLGAITHPGDCHHFTGTKAVLALPMTAPWGTPVRAAQLIQDLRPKYVVPIHDWQWQPHIRSGMYRRFAAFCQGLGVEFLPLQDGVAVELA